MNPPGLTRRYYNMHPGRPNGNKVLHGTDDAMEATMYEEWDSMPSLRLPDAAVGNHTAGRTGDKGMRAVSTHNEAKRLSGGQMVTTFVEKSEGQIQLDRGDEMGGRHDEVVDSLEPITPAELLMNDESERLKREASAARAQDFLSMPLDHLMCQTEQDPELEQKRAEEVAERAAAEAAQNARDERRKALLTSLPPLQTQLNEPTAGRIRWSHIQFGTRQTEAICRRIWENARLGSDQESTQEADSWRRYLMGLRYTRVLPWHSSTNARE